VGNPIIEEACELVTGARDHKIVIRLIGSLGVRMHCSPIAGLHDSLNRRVKDIDVVCPKGDRDKVRSYLESRGYEADRNLLIAMEGTRYVFRHPRRDIEIDVFVDDLDFNHLVPLKGRLDEHPLSIPLDELILSKLQVVRPTAGDHKDLFALLAVHDITREGHPKTKSEIINATHIAKILSHDWGFHHTATINLDRFHAIVLNIEEALDVPAVGDATKRSIIERVDVLHRAIDDEPKSMRWKVRAKLGERLQWWQDVDDPRGAY
jgi:hypothetical protein